MMKTRNYPNYQIRYNHPSIQMKIVLILRLSRNSKEKSRDSDKRSLSKDHLRITDKNHSWMTQMSNSVMTHNTMKKRKLPLECCHPNKGSCWLNLKTQELTSHTLKRKSNNHCFNNNNSYHR